MKKLALRWTVLRRGGEGDSAGEGGVFVEVGKKRKRKGGQERVGGPGEWDNIPYESLVKALSKLPEHVKFNCMREAGFSMESGEAERISHCSEFGGEDEFSPRLAPLAQEDADKTPCG